MAEPRTAARGNPKNAPKHVDRTNHPDPQHFADLVAHIEGRRELYVEARSSFAIRGYAPGDDAAESPRMLVVCPGCMVRAVVDDGRNTAQDASVLALLVAEGRMDIVTAAKFNKGAEHRELHRRRREAQLAREASREASPRVEGLLAAERSRADALEERLAKLEQAAAG